jgi:hypothetical protein
MFPGRSEAFRLCLLQAQGMEVQNTNMVVAERATIR